MYSPLDSYWPSPRRMWRVTMLPSLTTLIKLKKLREFWQSRGQRPVVNWRK